MTDNLDKLLAELDEQASEKHSAAWGRLDGGQDLMIGAMLAEQAAAAIRQLQADVAELQQTFDMQWEADMRAVAIWRAENPGNELVLPDRASLTLWAMKRAEAAEAKLRDADAVILPLVIQLDALVAESDRGPIWGHEDAFRMGEWFEPSDLAEIEAARAYLAGSPAPDAQESRHD